MARATPRNYPGTALEQAGLASSPCTTATLKLEEIRGATLIRLHSLHADSTASHFPIELPQQTGACLGQDPAALCLRPGEWLLISKKTPVQESLRLLESQCDLEQTSAWDSSDGLAVFRLSGPGAPWLLSKLSCLDFLAGRTHGEHCARTRMGHVAVIVYYHQIRGEQFVFDLIFDRSIAKYLWLLLTESASHADELAEKYGDAA